LKESSMQEARNHLLTPAEAGRRLNRSPTTLGIWRRQGTGPRYIQMSARTIMYDPKDLEAYIDEHRAKA
jgi:hypothetical protein